MPFLYNEYDMKLALEALGVFGVKLEREKNVGKFLELRGRYSARSYFFNFANLPSLYND
jgi:hypothetical protein